MEIAQVWCPTHREWERADDYIDFPVSPVWRNYYHRSGLTPYPAQDDLPVADRDELQWALENLADALRRLAPSSTERPWPPSAPIQPIRPPTGPIQIE